MAEDPLKGQLAITVLTPQGGDRFILMSDGVTAYLSRSQIHQCLKNPVDQAIKTVMAASLVDAQSDNVTVLIWEI